MIRCECKEFIDKGVCDKGSIWNPNNFHCECDKSCDIGEYLDYEICKCRKKLVDKLVAECTENIEETRLVENKHQNKCSSFTLYMVFFFSIFFTINVGIGTYFVYLYWYLKKKMLLVLSLVVVSKQRFNNINGRSQTNRDKKIEPITFTAT